MNADEKILFVDDEPRLLSGLRRQLHNRYALETASTPVFALDLLVGGGPFAVVVSDMRMPGPMNGAQLLAEVRKRTPRSVRVILTGQADLNSAIAAVNQGNVFRFLTKPCETETLVQCIDAALDQYRLQESEYELLEKTLDGAARLLSDAIGTLNPGLFSGTSTIRRYADGVASALALDDRWRVRLAATVFQIGYVAVPREVIDKYEAGQPLDNAEAAMFRKHPQVAQRLLKNIPRLEEVAEIVARQLGAAPADGLTSQPLGWNPIDAGAMILQASIGFGHILRTGGTEEQAFARLRDDQRIPDAILLALLDVHRQGTTLEAHRVKVSDLAPGMLLDQDVVSNAGQCLIARGHEITTIMRARLWNFRDGVGIVEPIKVLVRHDVAGDGGDMTPG